MGCFLGLVHRESRASPCGIDLVFSLLKQFLFVAFLPFDWAGALQEQFEKKVF